MLSGILKVRYIVNYIHVTIVVAEGHHAEGLSDRTYALKVDAELEHVRPEKIC